MPKLLIITLVFALCACSRRAESPADEKDGRTQQQIIVDRATQAARSIGGQSRFESMKMLLRKSRAVVIFPKLIKASFVFGGEGGNGVLLGKADDGSFSHPAFYSLGAPSVGLQAGFRETTAILFVMNDTTLETLLHSSLTLGAETSATLGHVGERGLTEGEILNKDIYVLAESGGAFAGFSLDGYVIHSREDHDELYYGRKVGPRTIVIERTATNPGAEELVGALAMAMIPAEPIPSRGLNICGPESRQATACSSEQLRVCARRSEACTVEPCLETWETFANACEACRDGDVEGYRDGACVTAPPQ